MIEATPGINQAAEVLIANDGQEGLDLAYICKPDQVFLDINMPNVDGVEFSQELKGDQSTKNMKLVMLD
jgi:CheY-like chemotaxis protein